MDAVPKENSDILQKEIVVPKDVAKALGRGLRQRIYSSIKDITSTINNLDANPELNEKRITIIKKNIKRITDILNGLEKAKEVRIVPLEVGSDFKFSEETEEETPTPGEVIMDESITRKFIDALSHTIRNPLNLVLGQAETIQAEEIYSASMQITEIMNSFTDARSIKMVTDTQGNTTITPIRASS
ncbi:MAG: hypothetical protein AAB600_04905 [Patescibacteria group bacterium]